MKDDNLINRMVTVFHKKRVMNAKMKQHYPSLKRCLGLSKIDSVQTSKTESFSPQKSLGLTRMDSRPIQERRDMKT